MSATRTAKPTSANGADPKPDPLAEAIAYEQAIADEATKVRGDATELTPALFMELLPLLRRPIPAGFIVTTEPTKGKPYPSTGIKSMQVQIDRLDNVLSPLGWFWLTEWSEDGRTASVEVSVVGEGGHTLVARRARGGVNQGSTDGNILKGSETNAAKLAFARLGVGHEVYLGAADFDPDVDPDAAKEQGKAPDVAPDRKLPAEKVETLQKLIGEAGLTDHLDLKLRSFGVSALADLTVEQGIEMWQWIESERTSG